MYRSSFHGVHVLGAVLIGMLGVGSSGGLPLEPVWGAGIPPGVERGRRPGGIGSNPGLLDCGVESSDSFFFLMSSLSLSDCEEQIVPSQQSWKAKVPQCNRHLYSCIQTAFRGTKSISLVPAILSLNCGPGNETNATDHTASGARAQEEGRAQTQNICYGITGWANSSGTHSPLLSGRALSQR